MDKYIEEFYKIKNVICECRHDGSTYSDIYCLACENNNCNACHRDVFLEWGKDAIQSAKKEAVEKLIPKEKPMNVFSFVLKGEELERYMQHKGWNLCRGEIKDRAKELLK